MVRPDHMGDLVMASPALELLRAAFPDSHIIAWLGPWGRPAWAGHSSLNDIRVTSFPGMGRAIHGQSALAPYQLAVHEARKLVGEFDVMLNMRFDFWWGAMVGCMANIPVVGYDVPECHPFLSLAVPYVEQRHEIDQNLELVTALRRTLRPNHDAGRPELRYSLPLSEPPASLPSGGIAIHAGAGAAVKLWDESRWANVADELASEGPILLTAGSDEERAMAERIKSLMQEPAVIVEPLTIPQLGTLYQRCRLVLGVDNGPLHLAEAVGTPTVVLFGPVDPLKFGPYKWGQGGERTPLHRVVRLSWRCIPCGRLDYTQGELQWHPCVRLIDPDRVLQAAREVLSLTTLNRR